MTSSIGVRVYQISLHKKRTSAPLPLDTDKISTPLPKFIKSFIDQHSEVTENPELERSWYFSQKSTPDENGDKGHLKYGTYGFESDFVDNKTKKKNYRRQTTDIEEIPLFYEFWFPKDENYGFAVFQSFQGRSCIQMVFTKINEIFEKSNPDFIIKYKKLLPLDQKSDPYYDAPVRKLRFIKRNAPGDLADKYTGSSSPDAIDLELSIIAKRKRSLGKFGSIFTSMKKTASGLVVHEGIEFEQAVADIRIGKRIRSVGVFGFNSDAGVIELSDVIKRGDGHPTLDSMIKESNALLKDFYEIAVGK